MRLFLSTLTVLVLLTAGTARAGGIAEDFAVAARLHRDGRTAEAMRIWQRWAERGDADGAYNLGIVLQYGDGTPRDAPQALRWYKLAAERDDKTAAYLAGAMLLAGDGVPADPEEAHRWFVRPRQAHAHHGHDPQMQAWRNQAAELVRLRDLRESLLASRRDGDNGARVVAELRRRAGLAPAGETRLAAK